jgi:Mg-chelatase subunit ChlD
MKQFMVSLAVVLGFSMSAAGQTFQVFDVQPCQDPDLGEGYTISWNLMPGRSNLLEYADAPNGPWHALTGVLADTNAAPMQASDYPPAGTTQRFYRVRAPRNRIVLSLVLDRSGSMTLNGGNTNLVAAVNSFITYFDNVRDWAAMVSFASHARVDVTMRQPFKADITNAVSTLTFNGYTCSEQGLLKGFEQNETIVAAPGDPITKVIVFFTDGYANAWQTNFLCGTVTNKLNIASDRSLYNPTNGAIVVGCTVPSSFVSIDGTKIVNTAKPGDMMLEAEKRADVVADRARTAGNTIYCIGLGNGVNEAFLQTVANDPAAASFNPGQPAGTSTITSNAVQLQSVFQAIAQMALAQSP